MNISKEIGAAIRYYRKEKKMTLDSLASAVCKSKATISKYESGQIAIDVNILYEIASALDLPVEQLLYHSPVALEDIRDGAIPAFFKNQNQLFAYYYDGRSKKICESVIDTISRTNQYSNEVIAGMHNGSKEPGAEPGEFKYEVMMYMNVYDLSNYRVCENIYRGRLTHYGTISNMIFQNQAMSMDQYILSIPAPYMNTPTRWALAFGISSRPLMPTSTKVLLSKSPVKKTKEFAQELMLSKEDIRLMKLNNMLAIM